MIKVVIDTDPGTDDALALMMALNSPELDIQGLTTVGGNASLANTTRNTLSLVECLGRPHMPVARGASRPLKGKFDYAYEFHGPGGLTVRLPRPTGEPRPLAALDYIISIGYSFPEELTLIALGPLTNVACAIQKEPRLKQWVKEIIVMGGAVEVPGNRTPHAEFNIFNDARAANVVFASGIPVVLVGLDVCNETAFTSEDVASFTGDTPSSELAKRILTNWFASHKQHDAYSLCDPLAMLAALQPNVMSYRQASVVVEVEDADQIGKTTATYGQGSVRVATGVDSDVARKAIWELISRRHS